MNNESKSGQTDERREKDAPPTAVEDVQTALSGVGGEKAGAEALSEPGSVADGGKQPFWKRRVVWIAVVAVVVIVMAGIAAVVIWNGRVEDEALSSCRQYTGQIRRLRGTSLGNDAIQAAKVEQKNVADAKTWEALQGSEKKLADLKQRKVPTCDATSRADAQKQQTGASSSLKSMKAARTNVEKSAKAVLASRDAKILKDTRDGLAAKVGQAKQLLDSSAGNVADDATRAALSQQIDAANGLLGNGQSKLVDLQQASQALDGVMNGVNASVQAKTEADAQAAAAAAGQAQVEAAQKQTSRRTKSSSAARGNSSGYGARSPETSPLQIHGFAGSAGLDHGPEGGHHDIMCFGPHDCLDRNGHQVDGNGNIISGN
ncbi:hypothetical protein OZX67_01540 [Bifidobacterium sp. ESL0728]|uniref:hypothetical protein n=1 Tax=Bifidobacterium sp. ESL0728 TaxID=2983220 RepID=UPI0023F91D00|nr:hypothetical protein [Bifidobacterium sp. ESL0728]WEV59282.1 hypothetical protein OZX67_01540 [Bifidobacterium sp. ESL0728]